MTVPTGDATEVPSGSSSFGGGSNTPGVYFIDSRSFGSNDCVDAFSAGAKALVIQDEPTAKAAWDALIARPVTDGPRVRQEILPWRSSIRDLARNFLQSPSLEKELGDMVYCDSGRLTYISRKLSISMSDNGSILCEPSRFYDQAGSYAISQNALRLAWRMGQRVLLGFGFHEWSGPMVVHRLLYESDVANLWRRVELFGRALNVPCGDPMLESALRYPTRTRIARLVRRQLRRQSQFGRGLSWLFRQSWMLDTQVAAKVNDRWIVGEEHEDSRLFTLIVGSRRHNRTEILVDGKWVVLPISTSDMVILPGRAAHVRFGLAPTVHRVVNTMHDQPLSTDHYSNEDVTLIIGVPGYAIDEA